MKIFVTVYMVWTLVVAISLVASGAKILDKCQIKAFEFEDHWFQLGQLYSFCMQVCFIIYQELTSSWSLLFFSIFILVTFLMNILKQQSFWYQVSEIHWRFINQIKHFNVYPLNLILTKGFWLSGFNVL